MTGTELEEELLGHRPGMGFHGVRFGVRRVFSVYVVDDAIERVGVGIGDSRRRGIELAALAARQLLRALLFPLLFFLTLLKCG
jgi:hypothetical protein